MMRTTEKVTNKLNPVRSFALPLGWGGVKKIIRPTYVVKQH